MSDKIEILANWGPCPGCPQDFDENEVVDFGDLPTALASWGSCN